MPRYFFHIIDGHSSRDDTGTELPDIYKAQAEAIKVSGAVIRDMGAKFWDGTSWKMEVTDELGQKLFTLHFSAEEHEVG